MKSRLMLAVIVAMLAACGNREERQAPIENAGETHAAAEPEAAPEQARTTSDGTRVFGADVDPSRTVTPLSTLLASPQQYAGQVVKTEGTISAVCQRMGCWMELRDGEGGPTVTVPMAGHSFFLPRDVSGKHATVEGRVRVETMDEATQDHLREEGASAAVAQAFQIDATGVVVSER